MAFINTQHSQAMTEQEVSNGQPECEGGPEVDPQRDAGDGEREAARQSAPVIGRLRRHREGQAPVQPRQPQRCDELPRPDQQRDAGAHRVHAEQQLTDMWPR